MMNRLIPVALAAAAGLACAAQAQTKAGLVFYSAGIDVILDDAKDEGLRGALLDMQRNGLSLPPDTGMNSNDVKALNGFVNVMLSRSEVAVLTGVDPAVADPHGPPVGLQLRSWGDSVVTPAELLAVVQDLARGDLVPDPAHPGLMRIDDNPSGWVGTLEIDGAPCAVVSVNAAPGTEVIDWSSAGLPSNTELLAGVKLDLGAFQDLLGMVAMEEPAAGRLLSTFGLIGEHPLAFEFAVGRGSGAMHGAGRVSNYGRHFGKFLPEEGIRRSDLATVPKDATFAKVTRVDIGGFLNMVIDLVDELAPPMAGGGQKPSEMVRGQAKAILGVDLRTEFINYLGSAAVSYRSTSTGGNGLMSTVMLVEVTNGPGMVQTLDTLVQRINMSITPMAQGYIDLRTWSNEACGDVISLNFPGIPVPVELSIAVKDDWLVGALTPQALTVACEQLDGYSSITGNPAFSSAGGMQSTGAVQMTWSDLPAQLADGYGYAVGLLTAVDNYTRHNMNGADRGLIMPTYTTLSKGAKPCLAIARLDGHDLVVSAKGDSSVVVGLTGMLANITSMWAAAAPAMSAGVLLPAISKARDSARRAKSKAQLRHVYMACQDYRDDHGHWPESLDHLLDNHYVTSDFLRFSGSGMPPTYIRPGEDDAQVDPTAVVLHAPRTSGDEWEEVAAIRYNGMVENVYGYELDVRSDQ